MRLQQITSLQLGTEPISTLLGNVTTVKPVLSGYLNIDKTNVLMENGSLMKVESIAECSKGALYNTFDLH